MPTLVLNAPRDKVGTGTEGKYSFEKTFRDQIGNAYAIPLRYAEKLIANPSFWNVILLDKYTKDAADGKVQKVVATGLKTKSGMMRYNVYMTPLRRSVYRNVRLMHTGIAIVGP